MGEWQEWKPVLGRIGKLIRKVVEAYVEEAEQEIEKKQKPEATKTYTCKQCGATFGNRYRYAAHIKNQHPKK